MERNRSSSTGNPLMQAPSAATLAADVQAQEQPRCRLGSSDALYALLLDLQRQGNEHTPRLMAVHTLLDQGMLRHGQTGSQVQDAVNALASAAEGIIFCTRGDRIMTVNRAFTLITGYEAQEAVGQPLDILNSEREPVTSHFDIYTAVREHGFWQGNLWSRRKSGENYVQSRSVSAIRNDAGQTTCFIIIFSDIWRTWHARRAHHEFET